MRQCFLAQFHLKNHQLMHQFWDFLADEETLDDEETHSHYGDMTEFLAHLPIKPDSTVSINEMEPKGSFQTL